MVVTHNPAVTVTVEKEPESFTLKVSRKELEVLFAIIGQTATKGEFIDMTWRMYNEIMKASDLSHDSPIISKVKGNLIIG